MRPVFPPTSTRPDRPRGSSIRPRLVALQVLPTLVTLGNVLAGFLAISYVVDAWSGTGDPAAREILWTKAAWAVLFGMVCDALDGRVARMTGAASSFGAELDSLADMVSFGVAPALLSKSIVQAAFPAISTKLTTVLAMVYVLGAALRLARYNVESQRVQEPGHVTRVFRGLPSPGAAGVVASLVLLRHEYADQTSAVIRWCFLAGTPLLGLLMVSRFGFPHVMNRFLGGARSPVVILALVVAIFLAVEHPVETLAAIFCVYAATGPALYLVRLLFGRPRWVDEETDDEDVPPVADDEVARS